MIKELFIFLLLSLSAEDIALFALYISIINLKYLFLLNYCSYHIININDFTNQLKFLVTLKE